MTAEAENRCINDNIRITAYEAPAPWKNGWRMCWTAGGRCACCRSSRPARRGAADVLSLDPSVVSRAVAKLEQDTGLTLLERRGRGVVVTDAGRMLALFARRQQDLHDTFRRGEQPEERPARPHRTGLRRGLHRHGARTRAARLGRASGRDLQHPRGRHRRDRALHRRRHGAYRPGVPAAQRRAPALALFPALPDPRARAQGPSARTPAQGAELADGAAPGRGTGRVLRRAQARAGSGTGRAGHAEADARHQLVQGAMGVRRAGARLHHDAALDPAARRAVHRLVSLPLANPIPEPQPDPCGHAQRRPLSPVAGRLLRHVVEVFPKV